MSVNVFWDANAKASCRVAADRRTCIFRPFGFSSSLDSGTLDWTGKDQVHGSAALCFSAVRTALALDSGVSNPTLCARVVCFTCIDKQLFWNSEHISAVCFLYNVLDQQSSYINPKVCRAFTVCRCEAGTTAFYLFYGISCTWFSTWLYVDCPSGTCHQR